MVKLKDVNTTDILDAIQLGCQTMCRCFNADDNDLPYRWCEHCHGKTPRNFADAEDLRGADPPATTSEDPSAE